MPQISYKWLRFRNGYAYRECEIPFEDQGLVLVRGLNLDDGGFLGAGKTSPFEVFSLLQTGKIGKQRKGERILADDVINLSVGEGFEARLRFEVDGTPYEIVQCRKHPKFGNQYRIVDVNSGRNLLPSEHRTHPQSWVLSEILRLDDKSFFNLIYLAQDFSNVMLSGTDGDRQQNLIQMFGLDAYDALHSRTKQKLSALRATAQDIERLREELTEIEAELQQHPESPEVVQNDLLTRQAKQHELQQQHNDALDRQEAMQERLRDVEIRGRYVREVKQLWSKTELPCENARDVNQVLVDELERQQQEVADRVLELSNAIRLIDQRSIIEKRLSTLGSCDVDSATQELTTIKEGLQRLITEVLPKAEQRLEVVQDLRKLQRPHHSADDLQSAHEAVRDKRRALEQSVADVKTVLESEVCPTCGRPFGEGRDAADLKQQIKQQQKQLAKTAIIVHDLSAELDAARQYEDLKQQLQRIGSAAAPTDVQKEIGQLSREEKRLVGLLEAEGLRETLQQQLATLPTESTEQLNRDKTAAAKKQQQLQSQYNTAVRIAEKLEQIRQLPRGKVEDLKGRIIAAGCIIRETTNDLVGVGAEIGKLERLHERLQGLTARRAKIQVGMKKTQQIQTEIRCLQGLEKAFGPKGLKRERFASILQDAAEQTVPYYTQLLWPRRNTEIRLAEDGAAVRFDLCREGLVTGSRLLSGGERNKAGLSLLFGMRDLKEKYTGLSTNMLIVDEPFANLDQYGTDCLLSVLQDLRQRFGTVLVIGNQQDVLTHDQWDQTWWAVRENNEAKLYREGLPERYNKALLRYSGRFSAPL